MLFVAAGGLSCNIPEPRQNTSGPNWKGTFHGPVPPGNSLYESEECRCITCRHEACCGGESTFSNDCSGEEPCDMQVGSCARSCYETTFRVPLGRQCEERRPAHCCSTG